MLPLSEKQCELRFVEPVVIDLPMEEARILDAKVADSGVTDL